MIRRHFFSFLGLGPVALITSSCTQSPPPKVEPPPPPVLMQASDIAPLSDQDWFDIGYNDESRKLQHADIVSIYDIDGQRYVWRRTA